jgi:hypothetical protein
MATSFVTRPCASIRVLGSIRQMHSNHELRRVQIDAFGRLNGSVEERTLKLPTNEPGRP